MFSNPSSRGGKAAALHGRTLTLIDDTTNVFANSSLIKIGNTSVNTGIGIPTSAQYSGSYFLHANGAWATAGGSGSPGGSNTYVQFNDSTALGGGAGFTFDKTTNNVFFANTLGSGNSTVNTVANSTTILFSNSTDTISATSLGVVVGNSIVNASLLPAVIKVANSTATANLNPLGLATAGLLSNSLGLYPTSNTVGQSFGNTISRWDIDANSVMVSNGVSPDSNTLGTALGSTTQRWVITANSLTLSGTLNVTGVTTLAGQVANSLGIYPTSNTTGNIFGNTISRPVLVANSLAITTSLSANGGIGTAKQALLSDATIAYWGDVEQLGQARAHNSQTANYTLALTDAGKSIICSNTTGITLTVPNNATVAFANDVYVNVIQTGAGKVTFANAASALLNSRSGTNTAGQYAMATLTKIDVNTWVLGGDTA